jgi:GNAT superfamily N-acetyltransferase
MLDRDKIEIRELKLSEIEEGFQLIWEVFQEFVAPDYMQEGIDVFYEEFVQGEWFREKFASRKEIMYGAFIEDKLVGVLSLSEKNTVSCVFIDGNYHRMGIGKALFYAIIEKLHNKGVKSITLKASPYAVPFYHHIGFVDIGTQTEYKGIVYTPMELLL